MDKFRQYLFTGTTFCGVIALQMILMHFNLDNIIDIPSMIIIFGIFVVGYYHYRNHTESLAIGGGILGFLIGFVAILANLNEPSALPEALAVALLSMMYAIIGYYFIYSIVIIYQDDKDTEDIKQYPEFTLKDGSLMASVFTIISVTIILTGAGFGAYM
jgi:flagellar motor component MotA